jgi:signal transduction histidine kinase
VRRRILGTSLAITLSAIALMTVVMAWSDWVSIEADNQQRLEVQSDQVAMRLHELQHAAGAVTEDDLTAVLPAGTRLEVVTDDGPDLTAGGVSVGGPVSQEMVDGLGQIYLEDTTGTVRQNRLLAVGTITAIGLVLAVVAVFVAARTSRRLTAPIEELAAHAERLGSGDLRPSDTRYGIAELDRLADSMDASVLRIAALLAEERRMTIDASHQLKTPLTALSLRLEELAAWPDDVEVRAEAQAALTQVERLAGVVDELLLDRRSPDAERQLEPLSQVIGQQLQEWKPAFDAAGRSLLAHVDLPTATEVDPGPVGQVMAALIENSLMHGSGVTTVAAHRPKSTTWVEVFDEGSGIPDTIADNVFDRDVSGAGGTGLGLAGAQDAAVSVGGRIALVSRRPAHFRFFLNSREDPTTVGPEPEEGAESDANDVGGDVVRER